MTKEEFLKRHTALNVVRKENGWMLAIEEIDGIRSFFYVKGVRKVLVYKESLADEMVG